MSFGGKKGKDMRIPGAEWIPDTKKCMNPRCKYQGPEGFGILPKNRPHHCRWCGGVFCEGCAPKVQTNSEDRRCKGCFLPFCFMPVRFRYPKQVASMSSSAQLGSASASSVSNSGSSPLMPQKYGLARASQIGRAPLTLERTVLGEFNAHAAETIMSFLDFKGINALLQTCVKTQQHFPVPGLRYQDDVRRRFPTWSPMCRVGDGGGGVVYFAEDMYAQNEDQKYVAVKVVEKKKQFSYSVFKRLLQEIEIQQSLQHPNIAALREIFQTPDVVVLVVEAGGGGSLRKAFERIKHKEPAMVAPFTATCVRQVASALDYLRSKSITHRDIKNDNIVLSRDYSRVMVIDFGLSERIVSEQQHYTPCGTQGFASPENISVVVARQAKMVANADVMHRSDIFSLGVVVFLMLSASKPFRSTKFPDMFREMQRGIRCSGTAWSAVPADGRELVEFMLKFKTSERATSQQLMAHKFILENEPKFQPMIEKRREELQKDTEILDQWDTLTIEPGAADGDEATVEGIPIKLAVRRTAYF